MAPTTVDVRLKVLCAFLNYLVRRDVIGAEVINRKLRIRVPEALPKAIDSEDVRQLLDFNNGSEREYGGTMDKTLVQYKRLKAGAEEPPP